MRRLIVTIVICCLILTTFNAQAMAMETDLSDNAMNSFVDDNIALT